MNLVVLMGRLTADPDVKEKVTKYTIAVDRRFKREGDPDADFFTCTCFGKAAEFAQKYLVRVRRSLLQAGLRTITIPTRMVRRSTALALW